MPPPPLPLSSLAGSLLYKPATLPCAQPPNVSALLARVNALGEHPLNPRQQRAFAASFEERLTLLWGPPGTGKTATLAAIVLGWLEHAWACDRPLVIGVGSSNWTAIDNLLGEIADTVDARAAAEPPPAPVWVARVRGSTGAPPADPRVLDIRRDVEGPDFARLLADRSEDRAACYVVGGTWLQLLKMRRYTRDDAPCDGWFDLLILDEASQVKVAEAAGYFTLARDDANIVLAGDDRQLGPVYPLQMPDDEGGLLDCVFRYMRETHAITPVSLRQNYRTNREISNWPAARFYEHDYEAFTPGKRLDITVPDGSPPPAWPDALPWEDAWRTLLDPAEPVVVVTYPEQPYTLSNPFEARAVAAIAVLYRLACGGSVSDERFWSDVCGVVTPHRAQMAAIRNLLVERAGFPADPSPAVDTVDRFQGQERDLILASYAVADPDFVASEEAFILDPRRFNVTLTRARAKFILFVSDAVLGRLPSDPETARAAAHFQLFVEEYCRPAGSIDLPDEDGTPIACCLYTCGGTA